MARYKCKICDYVYDEDIGDLDNQIDPGTTWANLPQNWTCKGCESRKSSDDWEIIEDEDEDGFGNFDDDEFSYEDDEDDD